LNFTQRISLYSEYFHYCITKAAPRKPTAAPISSPPYTLAAAFVASAVATPGFAGTVGFAGLDVNVSDDTGLAVNTAGILLVVVTSEMYVDKPKA
jgi:hypothetical protein